MNANQQVVAVSRRIIPQGANKEYDAMGHSTTKAMKCDNSAQWRAACETRGYRIVFARDVMASIALDQLGNPVGAMKTIVSRGVEHSSGWLV